MELLQNFDKDEFINVLKEIDLDKAWRLHGVNFQPIFFSNISKGW